MHYATVVQFIRRQLSPRLRLYTQALVITLCYLLIGRLSTENPRWVQVDLPLSCASVLLVGLSAAEAYYCIKRLQQRHVDLQSAQARDLEMSVQRQTVLNQISRSLIDKLDLRQLPEPALEKIAQLFEAQAVTVWVSDREARKSLAMLGSWGLKAADARELAAIGHNTPCFDQIVTWAKQITIEDFQRDTAPAMAHFCEQIGIGSAVFSPIVCRTELVGLLGVFYPKRLAVPAAWATEMQTVANVIAGAIHAEELYREAIHSQQGDSLEMLASGFAYDFNNLLATILACASYVKQQTPAASPAYRYLEAAETSAHRGAALTQQLLAFARRENRRRAVVNVNKCIEQTLQVLERGFDKSIRLHLQLAADVHPIEADPSQLAQVIVQLAHHARQAMPAGGVFSVSTRNVHRPAPAETTPGALPEGEYVVIAFRDFGAGMDEATLQHLFDPFFAARQSGDRPGRGLAAVQDIVKGFGGEIQVKSAPGKGSLFEVYLPVTTQVAPAEPAPTRLEADGSGSERILVVEDESVLRETAQLDLQARGYQVVTAADGITALALYREAWSQIDLVILDVVLPSLSGAELLAKMRELNPQVRVIVSSGYSRDREGQVLLHAGCQGYLQKPYDSDALCRAVRAVLDSTVLAA